MRSLLIPFFLSISVLFVPSAVLAQTNSMSITPSVMQLDLAEDKPEYQIVYKNSSPSNLEITVRSEDFKDLEDGWKINFLDQKEAANYRYSLSSWISFETNSFSLKPYESRSLKVLIDKSRLAPGGHYGSIVADVIETDRQNDGRNVQVKTVVASLLFVRSHTGQEQDKAEINELTINQSWWQFPSSVLLRIQNSGNTYFTPNGVVEIYDPFRNKVGKSIINENSSLVLPETLRRFDLPVLQTAIYLFPGIYTVNARMHGAASSQEVVKSITFFSFGNLWIVVIGILVVVFLAYRLLKSRKNRK